MTNKEISDLVNNTPSFDVLIDTLRESDEIDLQVIEVAGNAQTDDCDITIMLQG